MDEFANKVEGDFYDVDSAFGKPYALQGFSTKENDVQEELSLQALTEIDYRLAYFTEKLVNLHMLYIYLLSEESDLEAMDSKNNCILANLFEKAMTFDLLSGILDSEVRELDSFMDALQEEIVDARHKIFSCRHLTEVFLMMDKKLHDSEESVKQFQQQLMELKMQSSQLPKTMEAYRNENCETGKALNLSGNGQLSDVKAKSNDQMVEQRRYILKMLEKSLARELELERRLAESKSNEDLKLKLRYTEQVAFYMEEAAEVVWGRFLEADNTAEVLMGISKGIMGRLQVTEFNLSSSMQRENELRSTVQNLMEQLKAKDAALDKLETCNVHSTKEKSDVLALREKLKFLEKERKDFELRINNTIAENEAYHEHQIEMENYVESLRENIDIALSRAESAEAKVTHLTETNLELTEEINFLKGTASTAEKKVGSLEKQLRELDIQLQSAKASSEASQEQQNMLYTAIWDMEILIEELKSKVSKAESNNESAAEKCFVLSQTNLELNEELDLLRSRIISLKTSLDQASNTSFSRAKEIDTKTKLIMDMVMQLATQRESIHNQLLALKQENKHLVQKLKNTKIDGPLHTCNNGLNNRNEDQASNNNSSNDSCAKLSDEEGIDYFNAAFQAATTNKRRTLQKRINLAAPIKLCTEFLSHDSPEPTIKPCFCGRRHFIEASTLGTALFPIQPSVATGLCSDYTAVLKKFHPPRPDWYEEFYAGVMSSATESYEAEVAIYKSQIFSNLKGKKGLRILEIGIGTGPNLRYYAIGSDVEVVGIDPNPKMEKYARSSASSAGLPPSNFEFIQAVGEVIPLTDASVDAVVGTLVLCSVKDVDMTLKEVRRVLRPGGLYMFVEHVAAKDGTFLNFMQRVLDPLQQTLADGCHLSRETGNHISRAGFSGVELNLAFLSSATFINPHAYGVAYK